MQAVTHYMIFISTIIVIVIDHDGSICSCNLLTTKIIVNELNWRVSSGLTQVRCTHTDLQTSTSINIQTSVITVITPPRQGRGVLQSVCLPVCLSMSIPLELLDQSSQNLCADPLWPWLSPPLAALCYNVYLQFYGWHHVWRCNIGAESDVYECLVLYTDIHTHTAKHM